MNGFMKVVAAFLVGIGLGVIITKQGGERSGVYVLKDGKINAQSFVGKGALYYMPPVLDGREWNQIVLVNPPIFGEGEKIGIDRKIWYHNQDDGLLHWFYRDQVQKADYPVFAIKPGARSYAEDKNSMSPEPKQDMIDWGRNGIPLNQTFLINPQIDSSGVKVYVDNQTLPPKLRDGARHFFYRQDLILLNPEVLP